MDNITTIQKKDADVISKGVEADWHGDLKNSKSEEKAALAKIEKNNVSASNGLPSLEIVGLIGAKVGDAPPKGDKVKKQNDAGDKIAASELTSTGEFSEIAKRVLKKADKDRDGYVNKTELAALLQDQSIKGKDAQVLAAMYNNFDKIHNLSKHEYAWDKATVTAGDIDVFQRKMEKREKDVQNAVDMKAWAQVNLKSFAADGEKLTMDDINKGLGRRNLSATDRAALTLIKSRFSEVAQNYGLPLIGTQGAKLEDFSSFTDKVWANSDDAKIVRNVQGIMARTRFEAQSGSVSKQLFADGVKSVRPDAIRQGNVGNCYFESALAAVAAANPQIIKDMIRENKDGSFTVTFPGANKEPITVSKPTEAELGLYNGGSEHGLWAAVMEKAYGKYCNNHAWIGSYTPQDATDGGGRPEPVIELLTGKDASWKTVSDQASVAKDLEDAFKTGKAVTADIYRDPWELIGMGKAETNDKFYRGHAYSITAFKPDGKGGGIVTIRNPWGGEKGTTSGTIDVPLNKFMKNFSAYSIQNR